MRAAAAHNGSKRGGGDMQHLLADVEELLTRVTNIKDVDIDGIRQRVTESVAAARDSLRDTAASVAADVQKRAGKAVTAADDYAHENPWAVAGAAAALGLTFGMWLARR